MFVTFAVGADEHDELLVPCVKIAVAVACRPAVTLAIILEIPLANP